MDTACFPSPKSGIHYYEVFGPNTSILPMGDVLIDDGPRNLANGSYFRILFDQPHNRDVILWDGNRAQIKRRKFEEYIDRCNEI